LIYLLQNGQSKSDRDFSAIPSGPGGVPVWMINASIMESMDCSDQNTESMMFGSTNKYYGNFCCVLQSLIAFKFLVGAQGNFLRLHQLYYKLLVLIIKHSMRVKLYYSWSNWF
jgi:hypothetical protein